MTSRPPIRLHLHERAVFFVGLLLSFSPALSATRPSAYGEGPSQQGTLQVAWILIYGAALLIAARRRVSMSEAVRRNAVFIVPVLLALLSFAWSDAPTVTVRHGVALLLTTLFALAIADLLSLEELFEMTARVVGCLLCVSLVTAVGVPSYGFDHIGGGWEGVFATKNSLGQVAALGFCMWLLELRWTTHRMRATLLAVLAVFLLLESHSRTSLIVAVVCVAFVLLVPVLRASAPAMTAGAMFGIAGVGIAAMWIFAHSQVILSTLNRTPTLTGRTAIWHAAWTMAHQHFLLGYGYGGFWLGAQGPSQELWNLVGSTPPTAHNGAIDLWLNLGAVGVGLVIIAAISYFRRAWGLLRAPGTALNAWPMLFLVFFVMSNITESALLVQNAFPWILFVALSSASLRGVGALEAAANMDPARRAIVSRGISATP